MTNDLQNTISGILHGGSNNPAVNYLVDDYARYHYAMVGVGGLSALLLLWFCIHESRLFWKTKNIVTNVKSLPGKVHFYLGAFSGLLGSALGIIVLANLGNAVKAHAGFEGSLPMLGHPTAGTSAAKMQLSVLEWIQSGSQSMPPYIAQAINDRLAWQRPKAIICALLLVGIIFVSRKIWKSLLTNSDSLQKSRVIAMSAGGIFLSIVAALLLVMVIGNTQGSIAPAALTLFFA